MSSSQPFGPLNIEYDEHVLAPRAWTLAQAEWAATLLGDAPPGPLLELCCGAGQIGLAAASLADREAVLVDASEHACAFTRANAASNGLARVEVRHRRLDQAVAPHEEFALVLADPPYIPSGVVARFPDDPLTAIDGGDDGLDLARLCLAVGTGHLAPGASLLLQLRDATQAESLLAELERDARRWPDGEVRTFDEGAVLRLGRPSGRAATGTATRADAVDGSPDR